MKDLLVGLSCFCVGGAITWGLGEATKPIYVVPEKKKVVAEKPKTNPSEENEELPEHCLREKIIKDLDGRGVECSGFTWFFAPADNIQIKRIDKSDDGKRFYVTISAIKN